MPVPREFKYSWTSNSPKCPIYTFQRSTAILGRVGALFSRAYFPQQPVRKTIPLPPALPKRKRVQSTSTTSSSLPSTNVPDAEQSATSVSKQSDSDQRKTASPSISSESAPKEPFVRPHGFERGLTVERIHGFIKRADLLFAVVQFKNCDVVEILATQIVKHYEPMVRIY
ncbi:hypothetical protein OSTOST_24606 [Ostertagia ostertagi]